MNPLAPSTGRPRPAGHPASAEEHAKLAEWHARMALDTIGADGRRYDPRFGSRISAAIAQLAPAVKAGSPGMDQVVAETAP